MAITLLKEFTQGPLNGKWKFRTSTGSNVIELEDISVPHAVILKIYRHVVGPVPADGLECTNVMENWNTLEPRLNLEIASLMTPWGRILNWLRAL
jgi:hypothetical protein